MELLSTDFTAVSKVTRKLCEHFDDRILPDSDSRQAIASIATERLQLHLLRAGIFTIIRDLYFSQGNQ